MPRPPRLQVELDLLLALETDECVLWPYKRTRNGYANLTVRHASLRLHVEALERRTGSRPPGMLACHAPMPGGHPRHCINYRHLRWGTAKENLADRSQDGTLLVGSRNPAAKLSALDVAAIRLSAETYKDLARRFGVSKSTIESIRYRKTWRHVQ